MKRLVLGATAAAGAAFALHRLAPKIQAMHARCREIMGDHRENASGCCQQS